MKDEILAFLALVLSVQLCVGQDALTLPYFNIALKKKVSVNATCGENIFKKETYCKLVGYDSYIVAQSNQILDGQVNQRMIRVKDYYFNFKSIYRIS